MLLKKLFLFSALPLALGALSINTLAAQNPLAAPPSTQKTQSVQPSQKGEASDNIQRLIDTAEQHYQIGAEYFNNKDYAKAREAYDRAVDTLLNAGLDARQDARYRAYYIELVERIYKQQLIATQDGDAGFAQQRYDSSPLDELSKIDLDAEGVSSAGSLDTHGLDFSFTPHPAVVQFINFFTQGKGRITMETGLRRSGRYRAMAERIFKEEGVPLDIVWLAQVESVWTPSALSSASAKGIWQFVPGTGERFGLHQDGWIDDRVAPEKSTRAAARYLKFLNQFFAGDWLLSMAAYNCGENGLDRAIARCGYADFWEMYNRGLLPQETRNYVPAILAVTIIAKNPEKYGFNVQPESTWNYDTFELNSQLDLRVAASLLDLPYDTLRDLNPELKRGITPPGSYSLRLPSNTSEQFETAYNALSPDKYLLRAPVDAYAGARYGRYRTRMVRHTSVGRSRYRIRNVTSRHAYGRYSRRHRR
jgi:membrane-bound lytic murein transglycosylase D